MYYWLNNYYNNCMVGYDFYVEIREKIISVSNMAKVNAQSDDSGENVGKFSSWRDKSNDTRHAQAQMRDCSDLRQFHANNRADDNVCREND